MTGWTSRALGLMVRLAVCLAAPALLGASPAHDYVLHCAGCHRFDGSGSDRVPALDQIGTVLARDGGRQYLSRVPGAAQAPLTDARLAALLNWLVGRFAGAPPVPAYSAAEVGQLRSAPLRDPRRARACILDAGDCASPFTDSARRITHRP